MSLSDPLMLSAVLFVLLCIVFLIATVSAIKKRKIFAAATSLFIALLMLSLSALCSTISIAVQGYRALTREDLAATVKVEPMGSQQFRANVILADGTEKMFLLSGDELYLDAHILKWKPWANIFGLHSSYELDRVAGRYAVMDDEATKPRTVHSLSIDRPIDIFELRRRFAMLSPLLDAEYGSATFINTSAAEEFRVMVSTTGLLVRKVENEQGK